MHHFVERGDAECRRPNRDFDPNWYKGQHPDVADAMEKGAIRGPYHHYLTCLARGIPSLPSATTAAIFVDIGGATPAMAKTTLRLVGRALGWHFQILAPAGTLPSGDISPNATIVDAIENTCHADLMLVTRQDNTPELDAPALSTTVCLASLMTSLGVTPIEPTDPMLDRVLNSLRLLLLERCSIVPGARVESGPVRVDLSRTSSVLVTLENIGDRNCVGGAVLRSGDGDTIAEFSPPTNLPLQVSVPVPALSAMRVTISAGLKISFARIRRSSRKADIAITGRPGLSMGLWRDCLLSALGVRDAGEIILIDPPELPDLPEDVRIEKTLEAALRGGTDWMMIVPVHVALFPQAVGQMIHAAKSGSKKTRQTVWSDLAAIRHPDGHLASWDTPRADASLQMISAWWDSLILVLSPSARRGMVRGKSRVRDFAKTALPRHLGLGAVNIAAWRFPPRLLPRFAPAWIRLDVHDDGAAVGSLMIEGDRFERAGLVLITCDVRGSLAAPCEIIARAGDEGQPPFEIDRMLVPTAGRFAWALTLPPTMVSPHTLEISARTTWVTAHSSSDPRPVLFWLESIIYRPPERRLTSPSASNRER